MFTWSLLALLARFRIPWCWSLSEMTQLSFIQNHHQSVRNSFIYFKRYPTENWPNVLNSPYSWVDSNSGHLLHFARKPNAAIIHISIDLNLNHQSWNGPASINQSGWFKQSRRFLLVLSEAPLKSLEADDFAWTALRQYGRHHRLACIPFA